MRPVLTVEEMRAVDAAAAGAGTPAGVLVERAGTAVANEVERLAAERWRAGIYGRHVAVVAGQGNNGNDGRVAARLLGRRGAKVVVLDARRPPERIAGADLVVDAAFGTGFRGEYLAPLLDDGVPVVAVDVPTGVDAMTGEGRGRPVRADRTVTFGALKPGLLLGEGRVLSGRVRVEQIGLPLEMVEPSIFLVEDADVARLLPGRLPEDHKWRSALMVVAGSPGMYGAAALVALGALRAGAGMVRLGIPGADPGRLPVTEAVSKVLPATGFDEPVIEELRRFAALAVGPGVGQGSEVQASVRRLVSGAGALPTLVDADGLAALGSRQQAAATLGSRQHAAAAVAARSGRAGDRREAAPVVLTPHDGEFARLAGSAPGVDRLASVRALASAVGAVVLLKGSTTVVAPPAGEPVLLCTAGSARLATAGTGDVLSGVIGAFLARGVPAAEAAALGAHVHGRAASLGFGEGLLAGDLPELVAAVLSARG